MFFYCKLSILFTSLTHITFTVRCCNVMRSCLTVTRGQLHAQTMTRQFFWSTNRRQSFLRSTEKRKISLLRTQRSMFYESTEHSPRFHSEFEYKYIYMQYSTFEKEFLQVVQVEKTIFRLHASMSFRRVIRRARAIARLSLTSLWQYIQWYVLLITILL